MYHTANIPPFTYAGALKPQRDAGKLMRKALLWVAGAFAGAAAVGLTF